jgi:Arc/MetJ-type ribon-helix-helix transcriptional regulator
MKVELTQDAARWIEAEIAAGAFLNPEDAVAHAVSELRINALRSSLDAAVAEGGAYSTEDVLRFVRDQLEKRGSRI